MNMFFEFAKVYHLKPNELYRKNKNKYEIYYFKLSHYTEKIKLIKNNLGTPLNRGNYVNKKETT